MALFLVKNRGERNWSEENDERRSGTARRARDDGGEQPGVTFIGAGRRWRGGRGGRPAGEHPGH